MDIGDAGARRPFAIDYSTSVAGNLFYSGQLKAIIAKNIRPNDAMVLGFRA
jgi:hypothetical protein